MRERCMAYLQLLRVDKPIGYLLLLWPTLWGLWLASAGHVSQRLLVIFIAGVFVMRSAGCVINDMTDKDIDSHVPRTRLRPLASGALSMTNASVVLLILMSIALILVLQLNMLCIVIAIVGVLLTLTYPWLKRVTHFPQILLGIVFGGIAPLMAFAAVQNQLTVHAWWLFVTAALWPIAYDTIYALMDREDDREIGVHSLALYLGRNAGRFVMVVQGIMLGSLCVMGVVYQLQTWFYLGLLAASVCVVYQWRLMQQPDQIMHAFKMSHWQGMFVFIGLFISYY
jgi:4-hydroxybenzoate polyprenyltransferase